MRKIIIILISIFLLLSSFALGFFVKKHIDDKKIDVLLNTKLMLENKNEKFAEEIFTLQKSADRYKTFISDNWEKITDDIYLDKSSIQKSKYTISAWFKMYNLEDNVDGVPVYYDLVQYEVDCEPPALCCNHVKRFDKNGKLLADYPDFSAVCINGKSGWFNGETAYDALCKYKK